MINFYRRWIIIQQKNTLKSIGKTNCMAVRTAIALLFVPLTFFRLINRIQFISRQRKKELLRKTHSHQAHWHRLSADILWVARDNLVVHLLYRSFRYHRFELFLLLVSALSPLVTLVHFCVCIFSPRTVYYLILLLPLFRIARFSGIFVGPTQTWNRWNRKHVWKCI